MFRSMFRCVSTMCIVLEWKATEQNLTVCFGLFHLRGRRLFLEEQVVISARRPPRIAGAAEPP